MARTPANLKQADLTRYAKAMQSAGIAEWRVEVEPNGKHTIIAGRVDESLAGPDPDELLK
jgi:hypothetical protein